MPFIRDIMRLAMEETRFEGFPALRLMGFGKTAAISALSRRLTAVTIRQFPANMGLPLQNAGQSGTR